ncbi:hemerythrin domain-containing protein [Pseudonocardia sp.]|jgi:hemerythrin superfamily protein|uniref:hemerythrin domain-containing protein n=1 Tax=Pseudonocardia sp. TaxID=60912 RepID=UPI0031FC2F73
MTGATADLDVIDELMSDHREVTSLLDRIDTTTDPADKRELADIAITELVRHAVAEEMYVYPAMRENLPDGEEVVKHDTEEHKELERTMKALEGVEATDPRFEQLVGELRRELQHHVEEEESEQFPKFRQRVPHDERVQLREKVEKAKKLAPTRPHPNAPKSPLFHKVVGPGVGLVDRVRDKLTGRA